ncbi:MAG: hypothetical protein E6R03_03725 [Hyphomicrobiaceae bacterium]|nr:MAG: hypothetical protein E6R03_03725 [Hyphomicrobiaceae bacterium]
MSDAYGNSSSGGAPELLLSRLKDAGLVPEPEPQSLHANFSAPGEHIDPALLEAEDAGKLLDTTADPELEELESLPDADLIALGQAHKLDVSGSRTDLLLAFKAAGIRSTAMPVAAFDLGGLSLDPPAPPAPSKKK